MKANRWSTGTAIIRNVLIAPNNLSQTGLGIRGKEEFVQGWSVVFNASTGINPQSGQLANWQPPTSPTTAFPGRAIRSPATARARVNPSTTNSTAVYRPSSSAR